MELNYGVLRALGPCRHDLLWFLKLYSLVMGVCVRLRSILTQGREAVKEAIGKRCR